MQVINNIIQSIIANIIYGLTVALSGGLVALFTKNWIYVALVVIIGAFIIVVYHISFYVANFKWGYIYKSNKQIIKLDLGNKGILKDEIDIKINNKKLFNHKITGEYDWSDVNIKDVNIHSSNSTIILKYKNNKEETVEKNSKDQVRINEQVTTVDFQVDFPHNKVEKVCLEANMTYDNNMKPYYAIISRPVKKIEILLLVHKDISIKNIHGEIYAEYGDEPKKSPIKKITIKEKENYEYKQFRLLIRRPKLFYRYCLQWEWE